MRPAIHAVREFVPNRDASCGPMRTAVRVPRRAVGVGRSQRHDPKGAECAVSFGARRFPPARTEPRLLQNRLLSSLLVASLFSTAAFAQTMTVNPGSTVKGGETVKVSYSDPSKAKKVITVVVMGGFPEVTEVEIRIPLDENGNGSATWVANPAWGNATFTSDDVPDHVIVIV